MQTVQEHIVAVCGQRYKVQVLRRKFCDGAAPRLVVISFLNSEQAWNILQTCLQSIRRYTPEPHELWVVDNGSSSRFTDRLRKESDINLILNDVNPMPKSTLRQLLFNKGNRYRGSYANAVALEIAASIIDADTQVMMTFHMDTMVCQKGWLSYLRSHLTDEVRCVGVRMDEVRQRVVHVLGMLFDFSLFRPLGLSFQHNMPLYDAGDAISITLREAGYGLWACRNTLWSPGLIDLLPKDSPYRRLTVDRALNDENEVIFMHLGRGVIKSAGEAVAGKTTAEDWVGFGKAIVLGGGGE